MTLINQNSTVTLNGNGVTTLWPYTFIIPDAASARVGLFDIATSALTPLLESEYNITGLGDPDGGEVTYPLIGAPISAAKRLVIWRELGYTQDTELTNQTPFYPKVLEDQLDRIVMQIQQLSAEADRSLKVTQGSNLDPDAFIEQLQQGAADAAQSALDAQAAADAAEAALAAMQLPPVPTALNYIRRNAANTLYENRTVAQVAADISAVRYDAAQGLTEAAQGQARANIGAGVLSGFRNKLINGNNIIAQRGTAISAGGFLIDRWEALGVGYQDQANDTPFSYGKSHTLLGTIYPRRRQRIEATVIQDFLPLQAGATFTYWVRAAETAPAIIHYHQISAASALDNWSSSTVISSENFAPAGSAWRKISIYLPQAVLETAVNGLEVLMGRSEGGETVTRYAYASLVPGDATAEDDPSAPRHIQQELAMCQRYCRVVELQAASAATSTTGINILAPYPLIPPMRATPSVIELSAAGFGDLGVSPTLYVAARPDSVFAYKTSNAAPGQLQWSARLRLEAEF